MQSKLLISSLLASTVSAGGFLAEYPAVKREVEARATASYTYMSYATTGIYSPACQTAMADLYDDVPMPPDDIISELIANPQTDPCNINLPSSLSSEYKSYTKEVSSWYNEHKDEFSSAISDCPALTEYTTGFSPCETGSSGSSSDDSGSDSGSSDATTTASGSSSSSTSSSDKGSGASRLTGMGFAAVAVAGAAVALL